VRQFRWHRPWARFITPEVFLRLAIAVVLVVTATACKHNKQANTTVRERASFDLVCDPNALKLGVIDTEGARHLATQIAVYGCDKKAVYVYYPDTNTWVIDGMVTEVPEDFQLPVSVQNRDKKSGRKAKKAKKHGHMDSGY